jgi:flagellar hook-length control protein FliK
MSLMSEVTAQAAQPAGRSQAAAKPSSGAASTAQGANDNGAQADFAAVLQKQADARELQAASTPAKDPAPADKSADTPAKEDAQPAKRAKPSAAHPDTTDMSPAQALALLQPNQLAAAASAALQARGNGVDTLQSAAARWGAGQLTAQAGDGLLGGTGAAASAGLGAAGHSGSGSLNAGPLDDGLMGANAQAAADAALQALPTPLTADATPGLLPSLGPLTDASAPASPAPSDAPATPTASAQLPLSPSSPAFGAALSQQISHWLRDGVQHARVDVHPSNLGPISVRISVEDGQTHINLGAEVASTRQALADAMPQLAQSLRDVGLTLTGGGVFDQSRGQMPRGQGSPGGNVGSAAGGGTDDGPAPGAATRVQSQRGLLDLYA